MRGIGSHQSARMVSDEWLTPPEIIKSLGVFDLDPCAPVQRPWDMAKKHYTVKDNGLLQPWEGRVWCNPPYGRSTGEWLQKCAMHGDAVALIFARTETEMFFRWVWEQATALLFLRGRLTFYRPDGRVASANAGGPSVLVAYGYANAGALLNSGLRGKFVLLK